MKLLYFLKSHPLIKGTLFLTFAGLISRILGFFYRIFLSRTIGAEGMGIYQLIFPVYALFISLCSSGIQTAISRLTASKASREEARTVFRCGLFLSLSLSLLCAGFLYGQADTIALLVLSEARCIPLIRALAFALPLSSIHSCVNGYYYGLEQAAVPAVTQLMEQLARMFFIWMAFQISMQEGTDLSLTSTVWAIVAGECCSSLFSVTAFTLRRTSLPSRGRPMSMISGFAALLPIALPLTANRLLINLLSGAEAVLIPSRLQFFGHTAAEALSLYGVLTGMALPLILFPTAITSSVCVLLLPAVARAQSRQNDRQISSTIYSTIKYCLILGILFLGLFLLHGREMGSIIYENALAGEFLLTLSWISPFLYLSATLNSILNGLGKISTVFFHNIICLTLRILFVLLLVPRYGISACLWGLLGSQLLQSALSLLELRSYMNFDFPASDWILKPCIFLMISVGCSFALEPLFVVLASVSPILGLGGRIGCISGCYFFLLGLYEIIFEKKRLLVR